MDGSFRKRITARLADGFGKKGLDHWPRTAENMGMVALAEPPPTSPLELARRGINGHKTQSDESVKTRLKHAVIIEHLTFDAVVNMRESLSFDDPETARDRASALASAVKSWEAAQERVRILKGEPMPGARRPLPDAPKVKAKKLNRPPPSLGSAPTTPQAPTS